MPTSLYDISVGTYLQGLSSVEQILSKGADYCNANDIALDEIVATRLRDDMLPFHFQVVSVAHHSMNAVKGIMAGEAGPPSGFEDTDYAGLQGYVATALAEINAVQREDLDAFAGRPVIFKLGSNELPFTAENYVLSFSLPNFYFHATTTYDILRMNGVPLGKMDFLGRMRMGV